MPHRFRKILFLSVLVINQSFLSFPDHSFLIRRKPSQDHISKTERAALFIILRRHPSVTEIIGSADNTCAGSCVRSTPKTAQHTNTDAHPRIRVVKLSEPSCCRHRNSSSPYRTDMIHQPGRYSKKHTFMQNVKDLSRSFTFHQ